MCRYRNPIQCIIPPHLARKLAESKDPAVRARALRSLTLSSRLRGRRDIMSMIALPSAAAAAPQGKHRSIYTADNGTDLPGQLVRDEGDDPVSDVAVNEAYDGLGATYDLYFEAFGRNSLDDRGMRLVGSVHYSQQYDNAFFDGQQMVFGDGDGELFNRFTIAIDVIGHELTHGVTQFTNGLEYQDQSGALNESMSDVFGSLVKQRALGQDAASADWLIGAGLFTSAVNGRALRDMLNPGTAYDDPNLGRDPQPANMRGYVQTQDDNGGVHINSGIPNRAFALTAQAIGGNAWEDAGQIWYKAMQLLNPKSQFQDAADATFAAAGQEFGADSAQQQAVADAWAQVGLKVAGSRTTPGGGGRRRRHCPPSGSATAGNGSALAQRVDQIASEVKRLAEVVNQLASKEPAAKEYAGSRK